MFHEVPYWLVSLLFHLALLLFLANWAIETPLKAVVVQLLDAPPIQKPEEVMSAQEFEVSDHEVEDIGALTEAGDDFAFSTAPVLDDVSLAPSPLELEESDLAQFRLEDFVEVPSGFELDSITVKGATGYAVDGASGAIDQLTHEIMMSMEQRDTLVVWLFDQSGSLTRQRSEIIGRFDRIYKELGVIQERNSVPREELSGERLLTSIIAFGDKITLGTETPISDVDRIKEIVRSIEMDRSGVERVFTAIYMAAKQYEPLRRMDPETKQPKRNVLFVVVTDEVGDDQDRLEATIDICKRSEIPVYVIGVPSPFGEQETLVKWVDPDPKFDQRPQWGRVNQGPESLAPERVRVQFFDDSSEGSPIDSGFGPFSLTRLCYETGGIYFTVHPNRKADRRVRRYETEAFSAFLEHFFDPDVMRRYRPDYVSRDEYWRRASSSMSRQALIEAAKKSGMAQLDPPQLTFVKRDEADFANELSEAQKAAAKLEPSINQLYAILKAGEADRSLETSPRWQAGFDLAMGRVLALKTRTEAFNAMLAKAKRGLKFENSKNNTWELQSSSEISVGSQLAKTAAKANEYLTRVVGEHPGTPWALLAQKELNTPMGWSWKEEFTAPPNPRPTRTTPGNNTPRNPRDERAASVPRPPPRRPVPKL